MIKYALIGCGRVAHRHAEAITQSENSELVAVCDLNLERAETLGKEFGAKIFQNYHEMFHAVPEIDVVGVITPSGMHFEHASEIIEKYKKHVMIEKPFVMTLQQGEDLKKTAKDYGVHIFPVFQNRFNKAVQFVKKQMHTGGSLGDLRVGTVRMRWCRPQRYYDLSDWRGKWCMDGGALTNQGIHYIDLFRYLCGDIVRVSARMGTLGAKIEVEDTLVGIAEFSSGALGVIEVMTSARHKDFEASISCVGSEGLAVISGIATNELIEFSPEPDATQKNSEVFPTVYGFGHNEVVNRISRFLQGDQSASPIRYEDAIGTIELLHALYVSHETGTWVELGDRKQSKNLGKKDDRIANLYRTQSL